MDEAISDLRRERLQRRQRIEHGEVSREKGERLADEVAGIDRALNALESLDEFGLETQFDDEKIEYIREWQSFLDQIT